LTPSRGLYQFIDPGGMNGLVDLSYAIKHFAQGRYALVVPSSGDEPATPDLESDALTTRPTRLATIITIE
jgi:hypothetical protein